MPAMHGDDEPLSLGSVVAEGYHVEAVIGEGATSRVYRVTKDGRRFALKLLKYPTRALRARIERESAVLRTLSSPGIVGCHGLVEGPGWVGLLLEYVDGPNLATWLSGARPTLAVAVDLGAQLIRGVADAHGAGLVHRDLKPTNVLVDLSRQPPRLRLGDFGLVSEADAGSSSATPLVGTPRYLAPEQLREPPTQDARSDLFSLGVVLYELICGTPPFTGDRLTVFTASVHGRFARPSQVVPQVPRGVDTAIVGALEPDPDQRVPDAETLLRLWRGEIASWERPSAPPMLSTGATPEPATPRFLSNPPASAPVTPPPRSPDPAPTPAPARGAGVGWLAVGPAVIVAALLGALAVVVCGGAGYWAVRGDPSALPEGATAREAPRSADDVATTYLDEAARLGREGRYVPALELVERADAEAPQDPSVVIRVETLRSELSHDFHLERARGAVRDQNTELARNELRAVLDATPSDTAALELWAALPQTAAVAEQPMGQLVVRGTPGATVTVDGREIGSVPSGRLAVPVGSHEVRVHKDGYQALVRTVVVTEAKVAGLTADLASLAGPKPTVVPGAAPSPAAVAPEPVPPPAPLEAPRPPPDPAAEAVAATPPPDPTPPDPVVEPSPAPAPAVPEPGPVAAAAAPSPAPAPRPADELPATYTTRNVNDLRAALQRIERSAVAQGAPEAIAKDCTALLLKEATGTFPPPDVYRLAPQHLADMIVAQAAAGRTRGQIAASLRTEYLKP